MTSAEREIVIHRLTENRDRLLKAVAELTPGQSDFHPGPDSWSVPDCLEHLTLVEHRVLNGIERILQTPPEAEKTAALAGKEKLIAAAAPNRSTKVQAPEPVRPTRKTADIAELVVGFKQARERSMRFAAEIEADLHSHCFPHIVFGDLDCYQWLIFLGAHCDRHILQIEEIKSAAALEQQQGSVAAGAASFN